MVIFSVGLALAQSEPVYPSGGQYYGNAYPVSYHSSTAAEGAMRGMGDVVRAQGQANLDNSAAAINYSVARQNQIQNYRAGTTAYFDMRAANRAYRAAERRPVPSMADAVRYAQAGKPKPLGPSDLNVVTGKIRWPMLLTAEVFAADRAKMEQIFASRASSGAIGLDDYMQVRKVAKSMLADLKKQVKQAPPQQWVIAKRFVDSLAYAAGQASG